MKGAAKFFGYPALAFGMGILLTYFLPTFILIAIEIAIVGVCVLRSKNR